MVLKFQDYKGNVLQRLIRNRIRKTRRWRVHGKAFGNLSTIGNMLKSRIEWQGLIIKVYLQRTRDQDIKDQKWIWWCTKGKGKVNRCTIQLIACKKWWRAVKSSDPASVHEKYQIFGESPYNFRKKCLSRTENVLEFV